MRTTLLAALIASTCLWPAFTQAQTSSGGGMRGASPGTRGSSGATFRPGPPRSPGRAVELGATDRADPTAIGTTHWPVRVAVGARSP